MPSPDSPPPRLPSTGMALQVTERQPKGPGHLEGIAQGHKRPPISPTSPSRPTLSTHLSEAEGSLA